MSLRKIYSGASQFVGITTTKTLHTGPGKILAVLFSCGNTTGDVITLYDNTAGSGTVLAVFHSILGAHVFFVYPPNACPVFTVGLTAVTGSARAHIITEALA